MLWGLCTVGWIEKLRGWRVVDSQRSAGTLAVTAPTEALASIVFPDGMWPTDGPVTREEARKVPGLYRGIKLISTTVASLPMKNAPVWLTESFGRGAFSLRHALRLTVEDLMLCPGGDALWIVDRDGAGNVVEGAYVRRDAWQLDDEGRVWIGSAVLPDENVIRFATGEPGLQTTAADTIRHYLGLSQQLLNAAKMPQPRIFVKETAQFQGGQEEQNAAMEQLKRVLQAESGGIAWVPIGLEMEIVDGAGMASLSQARNDVRLDVANFTGLDPDFLAGSKQGGSDTYSNALQGDREFSEFSIKPWSELIADRLNQADVRGEAERMSFDFSGIEDIAVTSAAGNTTNRKKDQ